MLEAVIYALIYLAILVLVVHVILWVLPQLGIESAAQRRQNRVADRGACRAAHPRASAVARLGRHATVAAINPASQRRGGLIQSRCGKRHGFPLRCGRLYATPQARTGPALPP